MKCSFETDAYNGVYVRVQDNSTIVVGVYREHAFCTIFNVSALLISRVFELKFSLIGYVVRALYDLFVQRVKEMHTHFRSNHQMASYIM